MRRIDVIYIGIAVFAVGGGLYLLLQNLGLDGINAGIWSQVLLVLGLLACVATYVVRALTKNMTYNQQLKDYEDQVLQKRLDEMTPEELEALQAEVEAEKHRQ